MALTISAFVFAEVEGPTTAPATALLVGLAAVKVHVIGLHFMELRHAPRSLVLLFHGWLLGVSTVLIVLA